MPEIKVKHVVSCSSEDTTHKAENLLKADTYRKWKASKAGEKQVSVILQLEKAEQIHSLDIGNEGSAFVEVLVGHSTSASEQDYEVILVTSSFMSPSESKNGSNLNRVRMFGPDKLVKGTAEKKWDRVKIVCTQPYNKSLAYGLCFIRMNSPPDPDEVQAAAPSMKVTKLGQFKVKEEESSSLQPGALFFNRASKPSTPSPKASQSEQPSPTYAAAALHSDISGEPSASPATKPPSSGSSTKEITPGKRKFEFKENQSNTSLKKTEPKEPTKDLARSKASPVPPPPKKVKAESPASHTTPSAPQPKKAVMPEKTSVKKEKPPATFGQLLQGTVFVLSGFQNPFRSELRDKALEMGAKYRPDWTVDSTHLICAFANTPKYAQVKAMGGIIVRKDWILDCYKRKQRLPCKGYLMGGAESSSSDDDSDDDVHVVPKPAPPHQRADPPNSNHKVKGPSPVHVQSPRSPEPEEMEQQHPSTSVPKPSRRDEGDYDASTDDDLADHGAEDSGGDTEDELRRITEKKQTKLEPSVKKEKDPYAASTDENTDIDDDVDLPIPELPDFFTGKHFYLYGDFPSTERRMLYRYITAFNGELEEYMNEKVQYVITAQDWDDTFEEALNENCNLSFVKPRWIYTCNERQKLMPHQLYVVVPQA
ncbi:DNA repair protein XRCC1 isoform X2 [Pleurodeles waltl]|uniref:DNA repair protein XRCC1 isoform X2 n=1 Tax=Pleurodeles waltl TaxID=8319 RepID=UPI0037098FAB